MHTITLRPALLGFGIMLAGAAASTPARAHDTVAYSSRPVVVLQDIHDVHPYSRREYQRRDRHTEHRDRPRHEHGRRHAEEHRHRHHRHAPVRAYRHAPHYSRHDGHHYPEPRGRGSVTFTYFY